MRIVDVRTHVLLDPGYDIDATSSAQDTIVVEIEADNGLIGIGETDLNAWVARACIEAPGTHTMDRGLRSMLIGKEVGPAEEMWHDLYVGTAMTGRRGALINAIGAIDIALWDLRGKAADVPTWQLLGEQVRSELTPYASLQPEVGSIEEYISSITAWATKAKDLGFTAAKLEATFSGPYAHAGLDGPDSWVIDTVRSVREAAGPDMTLMVDVQYAFDDVERALAVCQELAQFNIYFLETPLWVDDLDGYAALREASPIWIAQGEWLTTHHEFTQLLDRGCVDVVQPDIGRIGGLTEALKVCRMAEERNLIVVPHAWKTGISVAAAAHLATVTEAMSYFEFLPAEFCESRLRRELTVDELVYRDGRLGIPERPGLGFELNRDALEEFVAEAARITPASLR